MAIVRHTISLSAENNKFAIEQCELLFDNKLSKYINFLLSKERIKQAKKDRKEQ